ncbi:MAG: ribonuclease III [Magnetococcales bacterium]|nr:ribonuclease III [Magnetococcales bacterium]NGZ28596.1 ribonuclease III [Magnetococcales bacterium]
MGEGALSLVTALQERLGYCFVRQELLEQALRHCSSLPDREGEGMDPAHAKGSDWHNERLEFLGDAVLNLMISHILFKTYPHASEGTLSQWRASLVNTRSLSGIGRDLGLGGVLHLGRGEALSGGREKPSILAGTVEAILGAAYLDGGEGAVQIIVERLFQPLIASCEPEKAGKDYKTLLQELLQAEGRLLPVYRVVSVSGAPHQREFAVECVAAGLPPGQGVGQSKRAAEQEAARMVVAQLAQGELA